MASEPLVSHIYTADPSAHVFNDILYIYPSHDRESDTPFDDEGNQYAMEDYHVLSITDPAQRPATDHGVALKMQDIPWVSKQLWAPDAAYKNGKYYLYFPARDKESVFRIGVAVGNNPEGPFVPEPEPIKGTYTIDPATFVDEDGEAYLYCGGLWGGQLQCWQEKGVFDANFLGPKEPSGEGQLALLPRVAKLNEDMVSLAEDLREVQIVDEKSRLLSADDHDRRFFEAAWVHKYKGTYYFSYSTGDTHFLCYATGKSPYGPFTYRGRILEPVLGWTTHHSIVEWKGKWWLFYHDCTLSKGVDHLRSVRMRELVYDAEGSISLAEPQ